MTGLQNPISSSIEARDHHDTDNATSPQQLSSIASSTTSTEPSAKSNPVSPADDDTDFANDQRSGHRDDEVDVLNVPRSNAGGSGKIYGGEANLVVDSEASGRGAQDKESNLQLSGTGKGLVRRMPPSLASIKVELENDPNFTDKPSSARQKELAYPSHGHRRTGSYKSNTVPTIKGSRPVPTSYAQWMSPPRNLHPVKRNWDKSPPSFSTTTHGAPAVQDFPRGATQRTQGSGHSSSSSTAYSYRPSPPPKKRISQKSTPSPFRSRSSRSPRVFMDHDSSITPRPGGRPDGGDMSTPHTGFGMDGSSMMASVESPIGLDSFSPMGFHIDSRQGSFSNSTPNHYFPNRQNSFPPGPTKRHEGEEYHQGTDVNDGVKPPKAQSPFSRFIGEMSPLHRDDSEDKEDEEDLFRMESRREMVKREDDRAVDPPPLMHPALALMCPPANNCAPPTLASSQNGHVVSHRGGKVPLPVNGRVYSPMPNLDKIRSSHNKLAISSVPEKPVQSSGGKIVVQLGQGMNSLETRRCFEGINTSMQREFQREESRSQLAGASRDSSSVATASTETASKGEEQMLGTAGIDSPPRPPTAIALPFPSNGPLRQAPPSFWNCPPSPPNSARQHHPSQHEYYHAMGAAGLPPGHPAGMQGRYPPNNYRPLLPPMPSHGYHPASGPYSLSGITPSKADPNSSIVPRTPAPPGSASSSVMNSANKENLSSSTCPPSATKNNPCNCKKSKCLKLYCECFSAERFCLGCNCSDCWNNLEHEDARNEAIRLTKNKNPHAFAPRVQLDQACGNNSRHNMGCKCKKSACLKKYCECFEAGVTCGDKCKCVECMNFPGSQALIDRRRKIKDSRGAKMAMAAGDELWRHKNVPGSGSTTKSVGSDQKPAPPLAPHRTSPFDYRHHSSGFPGDTNNGIGYHGASPPGCIPSNFGPPPNSQMHHQPYPQPHHYLPRGMPMTNNGTPVHYDPRYGMASPAFQQPAHVSNMMYQQHSTPLGPANGSSGGRHPMPPLSHHHMQQHMPYYGFHAAPAPMHQPSLAGNAVGGQRSASRDKATPQLSTPAPVATRLNFDPASSKKARRVKPGEKEPTRPIYGNKVPEQPKTTALAILSFLSNEDLYNSSLVCKEWCKLAVDRELWKF